MKALRAPLKELNAFERLEAALQKKGALVRVTDIADAVRPHLTDSLCAPFRYRIIVTYADLRAREICGDLAFYDRDAVFFPGKDLIFYQADIHAGETNRARMRCIRRILEDRSLTLVTTFAALMTPLVPLDVIRENILTLEKGKEIPKDITKRLTAMGYERSHQAETPGQFSVRGDIIDIFDVTAENPVRVELWGDEIDSVRSFDAETQRSIETLQEVRIFPATELILDGDTLAEGFRRMEREGKAQAETLRKQMRTEEAHRLHTRLEELREQVFSLGMHVNLESYLRYFYENPSCLTDLFDPEDSCILIDEPLRAMEHAAAVETEFRESMLHRAETGDAMPGQMALLNDTALLLHKMTSFRRVLMEALPTQEGLNLFPEEADEALSVSLPAKAVAAYNNNFELLVKELMRYRKDGYRVILVSASRTRAKRLVENLGDHLVSAFYSEDPNRTLSPGEIMTYYGQMRQGFAYPELKFAVISESDIFTAQHTKKKKKKKYKGEGSVSSFADLKVGDYVVHEDHGLGIYRGVEQVSVDKVLKDYLRIEYAEGGNLYIAATGLAVIQKYASGGEEKEGRRPKLNKLGTGEWAKTKAKVQGAVDEIAEDLVELYAKRMQTQGFPFSPDTVWQQEFEEAFPYEETEDQITAIADMKRDMESTHIMDRLICGDVGFGKTEIAIRGAFKAIQDSRQVAVLVPTTILAQQHYNTFAERFRNFPVRVELLSRFRTAREQKKTITDLKKGLVDIVIGTHRLLSADVTYKNLGLLVVDEEQRFGVSHKEKIKKMKENVDVLTLTATPIPRTLHMSLVGIRDMSLLSEGPNDRLPIQTFVLEYNESMVREAIMREIGRKGQVYYVYNRVNTIADVAGKLQSLVPEARIAYAHGQMPESELEKIMYDFVGGQIDVLVATTIIETGLDIPNVNTMIVHDSDQLGLAQLYQLRGRVGRSSRTAYAFLMYKRDRILREIAEKRLNAIREFTDLGSGYKIAMRDLEIRGAGNLLGTKQSGHMAAVGYELYCRMLEDAVKQQKGGEAAVARFTTNVDLPVDAFIPASYILNEEQKLEIYKRIAAFESAQEADEMRDELLDRFGKIPASVENLMRVSLIRMRANALYITEIKTEHASLAFKVKPDAPLDPKGVPAMVERFKGRMKLITGAKPMFLVSTGTRLQGAPGGDLLLTGTESVLTEMEKAFL
ncbi:MAG: transcription-repair coupling factor [Lachnospiraceae bacterium]|nr:transcription-repair coupling factor [Lachnospiraceae bacterium]